jgi:hypothetical protein
VAGHKKDVVLSNGLKNEKYEKNIAIYGWVKRDGSVIQGLNFISHSETYVDYSHGFRLVSNKCFLNDSETTLQAIWSHPVLSLLLHDEVLKFQSY